MSLATRLQAHISQRAGKRRVVVAWSGGVDSTLVLAMARKALGENVQPVFVDSEFVARRDVRRMQELARELGVDVLTVPVVMLRDAGIRVNSQDRCYRCKKKMLAAMEQAVGEGALVLDGTNADDDPDRPGRRALREAGALSPLEECGITKAQVRELAAELGLSNARLWSNSCLATRVRNQGLDRASLERVEQLEEYLEECGFAGVRARLDDLKVIVEVPSNFKNLLEINHERIRDRVIKIGLQLAGYGWRDPR